MDLPEALCQKGSLFEDTIRRLPKWFRAKKGKVVRVLEKETVRKGTPEEDTGHERGTGFPLGRIDFELPNGTVDLLGVVGMDFYNKPEAEDGSEALPIDSMNIVAGTLRKKKEIRWTQGFSDCRTGPEAYSEKTQRKIMLQTTKRPEA
ncbi:hypothetical protein Ancab_001195 [Ancistrocladus abbreviatus]